jgi:hypothetical protein
LKIEELIADIENMMKEASLDVKSRAVKAIGQTACGGKSFLPS